MERAEIHELSAAYALDALEGSELEAFEEHLAHCAECRENVTTFQRVAAELAHDVDAPAPPPALRDRQANVRRSSRCRGGAGPFRSRPPQPPPRG